MDYFTNNKSSFLIYKEIKLFLITLSNESLILIKGKEIILLVTKPELKI
jgi:hypothetical protein